MYCDVAAVTVAPGKTAIETAYNSSSAFMEYLLCVSCVGHLSAAQYIALSHENLKGVEAMNQ